MHLSEPEKYFFHAAITFLCRYSSSLNSIILTFTSLIFIQRVDKLRNVLPQPGIAYQLIYLGKHLLQSEGGIECCENWS
jgi:hypothetical protein